LTVTEAQLKANKVPALFVHGSQESDLVKERVTGSQKVLPDTTLKVIENGDHRSTVASPEFHSAVLEFVRKHSK
jgi:pimeloyl-ACP methyl ester carboxylesterase